MHVFPTQKGQSPILTTEISQASRRDNFQGLSIATKTTGIVLNKYKLPAAWRYLHHIWFNYTFIICLPIITSMCCFSHKVIDFFYSLETSHTRKVIVFIWIRLPVDYKNTHSPHPVDLCRNLHPVGSLNSNKHWQIQIPGTNLHWGQGCDENLKPWLHVTTYLLFCSWVWITLYSHSAAEANSLKHSQSTGDNWKKIHIHHHYQD